LTPSQERGKALFERAVDRFGKPIAQSNRCVYCHSGPKGTSQKSFDVGTRKPTDNTGLLDTPQLTVHQVNDRQDELQIVDVRSPSEWQAGHIPGAKHIFLPELAKRRGEIDASRPVAVHCASGYRASLAASILQKEGFQNVANIPGSWLAWQKAGYPIEK